MDRTRELGVLAFDGTPALFLGGEEAAAPVVDRAATLASAEMLGAADHVLAMTVQYAKDRVQFGKPIGSFQAVKHMLADALVDVEGMRSTAYYAAWCAAAGDPERSLSASMAKAWCSDASRRVMAAGLQVHGGIGFTWEHDMHLYLKRAQLDQVSYGDAAAHRDRIATLLRQRLESGQAPVLTRCRRRSRAQVRMPTAADLEQDQRLLLDAVRRRLPVAELLGRHDDRQADAHEVVAPHGRPLRAPAPARSSIGARTTWPSRAAPARRRPPGSRSACRPHRSRSRAWSRRRWPCTCSGCS